MANDLPLDNEDYTREFLELLLSKNKGISHIFVATDADEAIAWAKTHVPQLIMFDIEINNDGPNGLAATNAISKIKKEAYFLFITGCSNYSFDSLKVQPYGYILKPIEVSKFKSLILEIANKVRDNYNPEILTLKIKDELVHINRSEIIFVEALNHKSIIHTRSETWESRINLDQLEARLGNGFLRVHRSFLVNLSKVRKTKVILDRSYEISFYDYPQKALMSRYYYPKYREYFK